MNQEKRKPLSPYSPILHNICVFFRDELLSEEEEQIDTLFEQSKVYKELILIFHCWAEGTYLEIEDHPQKDLLKALVKYRYCPALLATSERENFKKIRLLLNKRISPKFDKVKKNFLKEIRLVASSFRQNDPVMKAVWKPIPAFILQSSFGSAN
jgi:hypothetical protein